jgi:hypothetical protein
MIQTEWAEDSVCMQNQQLMIIFAGPSLTPTSVKLIDDLSLDLREPVRRGDIQKLLNKKQGEPIAIVDGLFNQVLSVGHQEIMDGVEQGFEIWGLCSMGAIRAYELRNFGMKGFGKVYSRFFEMEDFQDDELALLHEPEFPYSTFTEPMVHYRACVEYLLREGMLDKNQSDNILSQLKKIYFGDRTLRYFKKLVADCSGNSTAIPDNFDQFREKQHDLIQFLQSHKVLVQHGS